MRILIVDDEPEVLASLHRMLRGDFEVVTATSGAEGLSLLKDDDLIEIIISDLMMPGMDGVEFLSKSKYIAPDVIRIMLTGQPTLDRALDAVNHGNIFQFLIKPASPDALSRALGLAIRQRELIKAELEVHSLRKVKDAFTGVVSGLAEVVGSRDRYTAGHQSRVSYLSGEIAKKLDLDNDSVDEIIFAGMVHDIGKIYVPAEFLCKPGPLSMAEMSIIRSHSKVGYEILKPMEFKWLISVVVLQHHERMDGSGYPHGLTGDEIVYGARIIAVADVVDAIISDRPYRRGSPESQALAEISNNQGKLYDYEVAAACIDLMNDWMEKGGIDKVLSSNTNTATNT